MHFSHHLGAVSFFVTDTPGRVLEKLPLAKCGACGVGCTPFPQCSIAI